MEENSEVSLPPVIKDSKRPEIQQRVDEKLTQMEDKNPHQDVSRTNLELISANHEARNQVAQELLNKKIVEIAKENENEAITDALTGLLNKRGFDEKLNDAAKLAKRDGGKLIGIFMDANGLKQINDNLSHEEGDKFIKLIADAMKKSSREVDINGRTGGDEFKIILHNPDEKGLEVWWQRFNQILQITGGEVSAGAIDLDLNNPTQSMEKADEAMYAAKLNKGDGKSHLMKVNPDGNFVEYKPTEIKNLAK